jgi:hypothetical protein
MSDAQATQDTSTIEGLPAGAIIRPLKPQKIEGLPPEAIVKSLTHAKPSQQLVPKATPATPVGRAEPSGLFEEYLDAIGVPRSGEEVKGIIKAATSKPGGLIQAMGENYLEGVKQAAKKAGDEMVAAVSNIKRGGPVGKNVLQFATAPAEVIVGATPVVGPLAQRFGKDIKDENYSGAAVTFLGAATDVALAMLGKPFSDERIAQKLAYASGASGGAVDYVDAYKTVMPDLVDTVKSVAKRKPETVGELRMVVKTTSKRINNEFGLALQPIAGQQVMPQAITQGILRKISPSMLKTVQGREMAQELRNLSVDYQKPWSMRDLDQARMDANARLHAFYNKEALGQSADLRTQASAIVDRAIVDGVQDIVYPAMDRYHGKTSGYFQKLKKRQSSLLDVDERLDKRVRELANQTAQLKGAPLLSSESITGHASGGGRVGMTVHGLQKLVRGPEGGAKVAVKQAFKGTSLLRQGAAAMTMSLPIRALALDSSGGSKTLEELDELLKEKPQGAQP